MLRNKQFVVFKEEDERCREMATTERTSAATGLDRGLQ